MYSDFTARLDRLQFPGNWCTVILPPDWIGYNFLGTGVLWFCHQVLPDWIVSARSCGVLLHGPVPGAMWRFVSQPQNMKGATQAIPGSNVEICFTASKHERGYMGQSQEQCGDLLHSLKARKECCYTGHSQQCGDLFHSLKAWKGQHGPVPGAMWKFASPPQSMKGVLLHGPFPGGMWRFASQPQSMKGVLLHGPFPGAIEQVTVQSAVEPLVRVHLSFRKTPFFSESFAHGPWTAPLLRCKFSENISFIFPCTWTMHGLLLF